MFLTMSEKKPDKMNLLHRLDTASRRVECQFASSIKKLLFSIDNFMTCHNCVESRTDNIKNKKQTITTNSENETNSTTRLSQNTLPSHNICSSDECSSNKKNITCNCNCIKNHRNQNHMRKKRRQLYLSIFSIMTYCFNKIFRLLIPRRENHLRRIKWIFVILIRLCLLTVSEANKCAIGLETPGWTMPQGDIIIKYGNPLKILCILNETYVAQNYPDKNSSNLIFLHNDKKIGQEYITVINRTTIMLYDEIPLPGDNMYICQLSFPHKEIGVCLNKVVIGYEPRAPSNFTCRSYNWENMTCTWNVQKNYVQTTHNLMFNFVGSSRFSRRYFPCPANNSRTNSCFWTQYSSPMYRQTYENYTFVMQISNQFGNITEMYKIDHFAHVIPAKPVNLSVINKTSNSATLYWELPFPLQSFPPGIIHKVMYQNQWDHKKDWKVIIIDTELRLYKRYFNLNNLEYANAVYDVRVYLKSAKAVGENMYGDPSVITFRTVPTLPSSSPRTDIGSFEIIENDGSRDIYLYWQTIPQHCENGDNFKYQVNHVEENGHKIVLEPIEITKTYAKFKGLSFNNYRFKIISMNKIGINKNYTEIIVPSRDEMPHEPIAFTKMAFEGGLYELSWKPPIMHKDIMNYTIFWCDNDRDRPYQCTGYLNWTHVSINTTVYNITVPDPNKVYQFAISANTNNGSSGMIWSSCTVIHTKVLGKMKSVWINRIGSDFIEVGWKLDCSDRIGIVEGFKIYYCPIVSPLDTKCKGPKLNVTIKSYPPMINGIVKNLTAYTTYMLTVTAVTKNGESQPSEPLYNTTLEAAPSTSPSNLIITNVTNTTMFITWQPPKAMNGVLRYYEIYYNDLMKKVEERNHIKLTDLLAYTKYNISVTACTVACSEKSQMIKQRTKVGVPGKIGIPKVRFINSSQVIITWDPPQYPAGPIDYYEIKASYGEIQNVIKREAQLSIPDCKTIGQEGQYKFRVRAINNGSNNERLTGLWSETGEGNCFNSNGLSHKVVIILWIIGVAIIIAFLSCCLYIAKRVWLKCRDMQDIEVKLPPGLTSNMKLLHGETRQPSADSSGCSSGQESVTSSLTTTEFQISSDSGTEIDPVPVSPDKLLETNWENSNSSSLRQRSVLRGSETASRCWESYVPVKTGDSNEILSMKSTPNLTDSTDNTMTPQTWPSTGYISMLSSEDLSGNPNSTLQEATIVNTTGCYSIVGIRAPIQSTSKEDGDGDGVESAVHDTLILVKTGVNLANNSIRNTNNSYVPFKIGKEEPSIAETFSLETFVELDKYKSAKDTLISYFTFDETTTTSKPSFQSSLIDTVHEPLSLSSSIEPSEKNICSFFAPTSLTDSCHKPFVSSFVNPTLPVSSLTDTISTPLTDTTSTSLTDTTSTSLIDTISTLTNSHINDQKLALSEISQELICSKENDEETFKQKTSHTLHNSSSSESFSSVLVSSTHRTLQQQQENMELCTNLMEDVKKKLNKSKKIELKDSDLHIVTCPVIRWDTMTEETDKTKPNVKLNPNNIQPIIIKHQSGYVTIAKNPNSIIQKTATNQSDERYSKVTVVPSTMQ